MITGELKNRIDRLWEMFWTGGITNPLDVIEQITYLMFIRDLDSLDNTRQKESIMLDVPYQSLFDGEHQDCRWSSFRHFEAAKMYTIMQEKVFPFIKNLHADKDSTYSKYMTDAIFKIPTPRLLESIVSEFDSFDWQDKDIKGDVYEYLLSKLATSGTNGQFRTPRHIIKMMVQLLAPKPDDTICDPACGTSGFLVAAGEYLRDN